MLLAAGWRPGPSAARRLGGMGRNELHTRVCGVLRGRGLFYDSTRSTGGILHVPSGIPPSLRPIQPHDHINQDFHFAFPTSRQYTQHRSPPLGSFFDPCPPGRLRRPTKGLALPLPGTGGPAKNSSPMSLGFTRRGGSRLHGPFKCGIWDAPAEPPVLMPPVGELEGRAHRRPHGPGHHPARSQ